MHTPHRMNLPHLFPPAVRRLLAAFAAAFVLTSGAWAADETIKTFAVPAGDAITTLKQAAQQGGVEIMFPAATVQGVKTAAVQGDFTPRAALDRMLDGTGLVAVQDEKTGALAVKKAVHPNDPRAAQMEDDRPATRPEISDGLIKLDDITVHGIRMPGPVNQGVISRRTDQAVAFQVFDRTSIERSGAMSLGEFFRGYSGNTAPGLGYQAPYGASLNLANGIPDTSDRINLRGLGTNKTVVLLNGRRLYGSDTNGPDVSRIPLSAVDRIEVLPGAAASIYGANAVGGAINIITKQDYAGGEVTLYMGTSTKGGANEWHASVFQGFSLNHGRTTGSVLIEHVDRGALYARQRNYWEEALTRIPSTSPAYRTILAPLLRTPRAAITTTSTAGLLLPGNPTAQITAVPAGYNNPNPTALDFNATVGQMPISTNRIGSTKLQNPFRSESVNLQGQHKLIRDRLEAYTELAWRYQAVHTSVPGIGGTTGLLAANSPVNPFRAQPLAGFPVGVAITATWDPIDVPNDPVFTQQRTTRIVGGLKGRLGEEKKWAWALDYSYDRNEGYSRNTQHTSFLNQAVALGVYTPFRDLSLYPNTTALSSLATVNINRNVPEVFVGNVRVSGELWSWRAGAIAISAGGEQRKERINTAGFRDYAEVLRLNSPSSIAILSPSANGQTKASRTATAAYAELTVPVFGDKFRYPLLDALDFSFAARKESYGSFNYRSTFGSPLNSTVAPDEIAGSPVTLAVRYRPVRDVTLRASYAGAFAAPTMSQLFNTRTILPNSSVLTFLDPVLGTNVSRPVGSVTITSGGNPTIRPEHGRSYNYGIVVTPRWLPGFSLTVDYFKVISYDEIRSPALSTILRYFPERVTRDASNQVIAYDTSVVNMSAVVTSGADFGLNWTIDTKDHGSFTWTGMATYTDTFRQRAIAGNPFISGVGDLTVDSASPLRIKGQSALFWTKGPLTAGLTARYTGHYKNTYNIGAGGVNLGPGLAVDGDFITSQVELDAQFSYRFAAHQAGWRKALARTTVLLGVRNLADRRPPYTSVGNAFYSFFNDPRQRFVYLEVKRKI